MHRPDGQWPIPNRCQSGLIIPTSRRFGWSPSVLPDLLVEHLYYYTAATMEALPTPHNNFFNFALAIEVYIMTVNKNIDHEQYKQTLASILPTQFEPGSLADRLLIQGREEGREVGREEGREAGREEGELIGKIQLLEELLGFTRTSKSELLASDPETLQTKVTALQTELRERYN